MIDNDEIEWLAEQYAIGALPPGERRLVKARISQDRLLADAITAWERRLAPLSLREPGVPPPPHLLGVILASLAQRTVSEHPAQHSRSRTAPVSRHRASWGRSAVTALAASLGVIAIGLGAVFVDRALQTPLEQISAILAAEGNSTSADEPAQARGATFVVTFDATSAALTIRQASGDAPRPERAYVLWLTSGGTGDATLIGQLAMGRPTVIRLSPQIASQIDRGRLLVTTEAETGAVRLRGPTIASGRLMRPR